MSFWDTVIWISHGALGGLTGHAWTYYRQNRELKEYMDKVDKKLNGQVD
jgi:hypothetical protein